MSQYVSHEDAAKALDSLDDYARMGTGVDAHGPRGMLERYIAQQAATLRQAPAQGGEAFNWTEFWNRISQSFSSKDVDEVYACYEAGKRAALSAQQGHEQAVAYRYRHSEQENWYYGAHPKNWWECQLLYTAPPAQPATLGYFVRLPDAERQKVGERIAAGVDARMGQPAERVPEDDRYYLQDRRSYVGNCPMWWAKNGKGYVTRLDEAHRYTREEAMKQHRMRSTDVPWPCSEIDALCRPTVDIQHMRPVREQVAALAATPAAPAEEGDGKEGAW